MIKSRRISKQSIIKPSVVAAAVLTWGAVHAQSLPVGTLGLEDLYRRQQLLGRVDSSISFSVRPLTAPALQQADVFDPEGTGRSVSVIAGTRADETYLEVLPLTWQHRFNSAYPHGYNDGGMIPARGYQMQFSAGLYAQYKWFSLRVQPEWVYAQNRRYEGYGGEAGPDRNWYTVIGNRIDMPELFGNGRYTKLLPGQSSFRVTYHPVSIGISTENLWWGPGRYNSLQMSNTAPGFAHLTLNTSKPIRTYIGSFEGQLVAGRLEASGYPPSLLGNVTGHSPYAVAKPDDWRYFNGAILTYQPRWVPGLTLGVTRTFSVYRGDMGSGLRDYLPILLPAYKKDAESDPSQDRRTDEQATVFFRWVLPRAHAEVYAEYGRNDHSLDFRDLFTQADHSRAYLIGLRKLVPLKAENTFLQVDAELTQLAATNTQWLRASSNWFSHHQVRDGYTHRGQLLGAGIGPGSNIQSVGISWVRGIREVGIRAERLVHNETFAAKTWEDRRRNWVDLGFLAHATWDFERLVATAGLQYIHAYNYQYRLQNAADGDYWGFDTYDKNNVHLQLGLQYRF